MRKTMRRISSVTVLLGILATVSCAGGGGGAGPPADVEAGTPDARAGDVATVDQAAADAARDRRPAELPGDLPPEQTGDQSPPTVEFAEPLDGAEVEGVVAIVVDATDDSGVVSVELFADGAFLGTDDEAPYGFQWDATELWSGDYALKAVAVDAAGNVGEAGISVTVLGECDETGDCPPTVVFDAPEAGAFVGGAAEIKVNAGDDDAVVKVRFLVDGGVLLEDDQVPWKAAWDTAEFDDGPHVVEAVAWDTTDKTASAQIEVVVDNTPPELALLSPEEGVIQHDGILLAAEATDTLQMDRVEFSVDGGEPLVLSAGPWEIEYDGSELAAGIHAVTAIAVDAAGNETTVEREFLVDRPPVVAILAPEQDTEVDGAISVLADAADDLGLEDVVLYMDDAWMAEMDPAGDGVFEDLWLPPYEKAERILSVVATDSAGQEGVATVTVQVDHPVTVELQLCADEACGPLAENTELSGAVLLRAVAEDDGAEIMGVDFLVEGEPAHQDLEVPFDFSWDTTSVEDGARALEAVASNALDETGAAQVIVIVNNCDLDHDDFVAAGCGGPDCDDGSADFNPAAPDTVGDDADQNCDGLDGVDADGDGYASEASGGDDCDDEAPAVHPCGDDLPGDGVDGNCDGVDALSCDDCVACTVDGLVGDQCVHAPVEDGGPCDDGDLCTGAGSCQDLVCVPGEALDCDDLNPCTGDGCVSDSGCYNLPLDGLPCGDGGVCVEGSCCLPACDGLACGDDGCGGSCGGCAPDLICVEGACVDPCTPDCAGKFCVDDGCGEICPCGPGFTCADGACVLDPATAPGPGPGPDCAGLLPPLLCQEGPDQCTALIQFDPAEGYGYTDFPVNGETWEDQWRSWLRRDAVMMMQYATAYVACKAADWDLGNGGPLGLADMSEEDGAIPGTSVGTPGHPPGTHTSGHDIDVAYYQAGTADNQVRPICYHGTGGVDAYHCVAPPHLLDPWRAALFVGALQEHPDLRVVGCDGQAGPPIAQARQILCSQGWLSGFACNNDCLAYETENQGSGWFYFHHAVMHVSFDNPSCIPDCTGLECGNDGCGGSCGDCFAGPCEDGVCPSCEPQCEGLECGDDGCGGTCGVCPLGETCGDAGLCETSCVVSSKVVLLEPGEGGHPGEALDVDDDPGTCNPVDDCEQGLDNELYGVMGALPIPLPGQTLAEVLAAAVESGEATVLISASGSAQAGQPFTLGLFEADVATPPGCDVQGETCGYTLAEGSPPAQFDNAQIVQGQLTAGGPAYDVEVPCWVAPWACMPLWFVSGAPGGYVAAYNVRIDAMVSADGCEPLTLQGGVIGGAVLKQDIIDMVMQIPEDQLPISKEMLLSLLNMILTSDIDVDGDGDKEGISFGMKIAGIPADLVPAECGPENPYGTCPEGLACYEGACLAACGFEGGPACTDAEICIDPEGTCGAGDAGGVCVPYPFSCPDVWEPVCGCDGQTYASECAAKQAGQSWSATGTCAPCNGPGDIYMGEPYEACCDGLTAVPPCAWDDGECLCLMCMCWSCTACGNGSCGPGEDPCNCPEDCTDCSDPFACEADADCVKDVDGCCPCSQGGTPAAFNGACVEGYKDSLACPPDLPCPAIYMCDDTEPFCVEGQCVLSPVD